MTDALEAATRAKNAMQGAFGESLREHAPYASWALSMDNSMWVIRIGCLYMKLREATKEKKGAVHALLGTSYLFEGVRYPLEIYFGEVPRAF